jgi:transposase
MDVFIGLDVSLSKTSVCVVDRDGVVLWQGKVASEPGPLIARLAEWSGTIALAGIEACPLSEWLHRGLREAGIPVVCIEVRHAQRFLSTRPIKTDRNDARGIADMMRLGHYRPVHVKLPAAQAMRTTLAVRMQLVAAQLQIENDQGPTESLRIEDRRDTPQPLRGARHRSARHGIAAGIGGSDRAAIADSRAHARRAKKRLTVLLPRCRVRMRSLAD